MTKFIVSFILLSDTISQCRYITEDNNRVKIDPDKLRNGLDHYASSSDKAELYEFLAKIREEGLSRYRHQELFEK
jgi:hypothetical protein